MKSNKIILISLVLMFVIGIAVAEGVNLINKQIGLDKSVRDYLLTKTTEKEIKPTITIECLDRTCKYSAVQSGIISSYDNVIDRYYCAEYNKTLNGDNQTTNECLREVQYTTAEIEDIVANAVTNKLTNYANASSNRDSYIKISEGTITYTQK